MLAAAVHTGRDCVPTQREDTMAITARFYVSEVTKYAGRDDQGTVRLRPSYANGANKEWASATPTGEITMGVNNPEAFAEFDAARLASDDIHITFERHPRATV